MTLARGDAQRNECRAPRLTSPEAYGIVKQDALQVHRVIIDRIGERAGGSTPARPN